MGGTKLPWLTYLWEDLKKQKVKTSFAVGGICVSMILLTAIGALNDSLSASYLDITTTEVGSADLVISKTLELDMNLDFFFDESIIDDKLQDEIDEIDYYFPRLLFLIRSTRVNPATELTEDAQFLFYGLKNNLESESGKMGRLWILDEDFQRTGELFTQDINPGECVLLRATARSMNVSVGDTIPISYLNKDMNLTVQAIVEQDLRFTVVETGLILTDLAFAQDFLNQPGKVNYVMATLRDREYIYDVRDLEGTRREIIQVGEQIQTQIGFDYQIQIPKLEQLEFSEYLTMTMTMMFWFMTFLSMLITGILINSILTTSVEERIREFGILRVVGAKTRFTVSMVIVQGFLIGVVSTALGTAIGAIFTPLALDWYLYEVLQWDGMLTFLILPSTIFQSLTIGIIATTVISILPALKAGKFTIANAIDPTRTSTGEEYTIKKEGSSNRRLIWLGFAMGITGFFIFVLLPRILVQGNMMLLVAILTALLLAILIGLVFACIGLIPAFEKIIAQFFRPLVKKYYPIYKTSLLRNRRRNNGTILMFALTFSFIFFISTAMELDLANIPIMLRFQYGGDLVVTNDGTPEEGDAINFGMMEELRTLRGVREVAPVLYNTLDITRVLALLDMGDGLGGGFDFSDFSFSALYGEIDKYHAYVADIGNFKSTMAGLTAVDPNYLEIVDHSLVLWDRDSGSSMESFQALFNNPNGVIISKAIADYTRAQNIGDEIRLTIRQWDNATQRHIYNTTLKEVVGISTGMPGFWNFRSNINSVYEGGVMLNMETYCELMDWGDPNEDTTPVDKYLVRLSRQDDETIRSVQEYIEDFYADEYRYTVSQPVTFITLMEDSYATINTALEAVYIGALLISLFGLLSTMNSMLIERMYEVGVLRSMGMKSYEVRTLFTAEALTLLLAAGGFGTIIGSLTGFLLFVVMGAVTEIPVVFSMNWGHLFGTFAICIIVSIVGMLGITHRMSKSSIMDIFRQTF